jgi:diguanylate cyclase (GGDEF)-like protein
MLADIEAELDAFKSQLLKPIESKTQHIVKVHEGQQRLEIARHTIQSEIDKRIAGKAVSTVIPLLLDAGWQHLLVLAELNQDTQAGVKEHYLKVIDDLMFWLYEQDSIVKMQASSIQTTITYVDEQLQAVGAPVQKRKHVIQELTELLIGIGQPKVRKAIQTVKIPRPKPDQETVLNEEHRYWDAMIEQLAVGDWLNIKHDSDDFESMKIIWIGTLPHVFVLLSADGLKNIELDKQNFIGLFQQGYAVSLDNMDVPLTDRTSNLMLQDMHDTIKFNAIHDADTHLILRDEFVKQLKIEISKETDFQHVLCHIEILDFRLITNICGLDGSKQLLKTIATLLSDRIKSADILARLGDQSFAVLYKECSANDAFEFSRNLLKHIGSSQFTWNEKCFPITLSMGLVPVTDTSFDLSQLLQQADAASMEAEQSGPNQVKLFTGNNDNLQHQANLFEWMSRIDGVFAEERLFTRCQKITSLDTSVNHVHYEILLGIKDEDGNIIQADYFIPAVERCKRMPEIDIWVINAVFDWIESNKSQFDAIDGFAINLSGQSINSQEFLDFLQTKLDTCLFQADKIVFEITETIASENLTFTKKFIKAIKQYGCKFSLDDFGSGYSSYAYLKNMDVDYLKIDGAFVKDIANNPADFAIVKSMNEIAHSLNLQTIAEYIENDEINEIIKAIGVDYGQGYFIHKPIPLADLIIAPPEKDLFYFEDNSFWDI